jgi:hypothetical protein
MLAQRVLLSLLLLIALIGVNAPARADFWENMFDVGGGAAPAPINRPAAASPEQHRRHHAAKTPHRHEIARLASHAAWSANHSGHRLQALGKPTADVAQTAPRRFNTGAEAAEAAKSDATLKPGDIVSSAEGLLVYIGDARGVGRHDDFVPAEDRRVKARLRKLLSAYATPERPLATPALKKSQPAKNADAPAKAKAAPSALQAIQHYVSDSQGKRIRFVGGHIPQ